MFQKMHIQALPSLPRSVLGQDIDVNAKKEARLP